MAKLGAMMQLARLASNSDRTSSMSASLKPLVPTTACTLCSAHQRMLPMAAVASVKSTATSASVSLNADGSGAIWRWSISAPVTWRTSRPECDGSTAATSSRSGSPTTAWQTVEPMRPPAPKTPTRITGSRYAGPPPRASE
jgi:hypothetical protein